MHISFFLSFFLFGISIQVLSAQVERTLIIIGSESADREICEVNRPYRLSSSILSNHIYYCSVLLFVSYPLISHCGCVVVGDSLQSRAIRDPNFDGIHAKLSHE